MYHGASRDRGDKMKRQRLTPPPSEVWMDAIMSKSKASGWSAGAAAGSRSVTSTSSALTSSGWNSRGTAPTQYQQFSSAPSVPPQYQQYSTSSTDYRGATRDEETKGPTVQTGQKAPSEAEEMLREQANLDDVVLREAFAIAMQELVAERECSFVAKGLCHLCGVKENHYMPVVNFCPHANEAHSLCREHLRSIYGVRLENLFAAKEHAVPNQRSMRCMVCTRGCPCSTCIQEKQDELTRYKRYLIAELRRSHTQPAAMKSGRPVAVMRADGRMMIADRAGGVAIADGRATRDGRSVAAAIADGRTIRDGRSVTAAIADGRTMRDGRSVAAAAADGRAMRDDCSVAAPRDDGQPMRDDSAGFVIRIDGRKVGADCATPARANERMMSDDGAGFSVRSDGRTLGDDRVTTPTSTDGRTMRDDDGAVPVISDGQTLEDAAAAAKTEGRAIGVDPSGATRTTMEDGHTTFVLRANRRPIGDDRSSPAEGRTVRDADVVRADGRMIYSSKHNRSSSDSRRFKEYIPTAPPTEGRTQRDEHSSRSSEKGDGWEERRKMPSQQSSHEHYAVGAERNSRGNSSNMQAQQKLPTRAPLVPKRAAKDVSAEMLSMIADNAQATDPPSAARNASPHVHQGSVESPSAAHVLNCAESEKSLVQLLSALHQNAMPGSSVAMDTSTSSTFGRDHQQDTRFGTNEIAAKRDHEQADSPAKSTSSYKDRSSTSSMDSRGSPTPRTRPEGVAHTAEGLTSALARKRKADGSDFVGSPLARGSAQYNDKTTVAKGQNVAVKRRPGRPRKYNTDAAAGIAHSGSKVARRKPGRPPKRKYHDARSAKRGESSDDDDEADDEDEADDDDESMDADGSDSELDANLDFCEVCQTAGDLVCCDKCPRSYHLACLHMKESDLPEGDWQCDECKKPSRFEAYSSAVAAEQSLLDKCLKIVTCLKSHPFAKPFLSPVENVPMYTRIVKQPMDLSTIEEKLKNGAYIMDTEASVAGVKELNVERFANDIQLMWSNCKLFNDDGSGITRAADQLSRGFERLFKESTQSPLDSQS